MAALCCRYAILKKSASRLKETDLLNQLEKILLLRLEMEPHTRAH